MNTYIALLRGIGGKYTLPSKTFLEILDAVGAKDARTYIATGNAVFRSRATRTRALAGKIQAAIDEARGFAPEVLILTPEELDEAMARNPYPEAVSKPTSLHLTFLSAVPENPDLERLERLRADGERFELIDRVFYMHALNGFGRSKLFARIETCLGVWCTARNWRSVVNIKALADELG